MEGLLCDLPTPAFVVNRPKVLANCQRMLDYCKARNVVLRPHMKTHKCVEVARMMTAGMANSPITVSTIAEAELFAKNGFNDILFAHYAVDETRIKRLHALMSAPSRPKIHVFVDSAAGLEILEKHPLGDALKWSVYLKIDCGYGRAGTPVDSEATFSLALKIANGPASRLHGIYAHDGDSYYATSSSGAVEAGRRCGERLSELAARLHASLPSLELAVAIGSTPSCFSYTTCDFKLPAGVTELHPGAYAFCDTQQAVAVGSCSGDNIACCVVTRVVGHSLHRKHLIVDAGFTALSHDLGKIEDKGADGSLTSPRFTARVRGHDELVIVRVTQEIGIIRAADETKQPLDFSRYPVGSILVVEPYHCCATADKFAHYYVTDDDVTVVDMWSPAKGW